MDFSWSAFFVGVMVAFAPMLLIGEAMERRRSAEEQRYKDATISSEIKHLRWMVCELEAGRRPPEEYLENNRAAMNLERWLEGNLQKWDSQKASARADRKRDSP